jgi:tetratricopeptide (TPR) repeat protein
VLGEAERAQLRALGYPADPAAAGPGAAADEPGAGIDPKDRVEVFRELQLALALVEGGELEAGVQLLIRILAERDPANRRAAAALAELALEPPVRPRAAEALGRIELGSLDRATAAFVATRLGLALVEEGRAAEATAPLERAAELAPGEAGPLLALAALRERAGDLDGAIALYERALARDPGNAIAANDLAFALGREGHELERALALVAGALAREPGRAAFHDTRGFLLIALGRPREARAALEEALRLDPQSAAARRHLELLGPGSAEPGASAQGARSGTAR